jgi:hypothetical protein
MISQISMDSHEFPVASGLPAIPSYPNHTSLPYHEKLET